MEKYNVVPVDKKDSKINTICKNMVPYEPFDFYIQRKLYMHNMAHAMTAYLGKYKGYEALWQACEILPSKYRDKSVVGILYGVSTRAFG